MALAYRLPEQMKVIDILNPAADAAGRTGTWITCRWAHKVYFVVHITQGNAATILISLLQAKDVSGTGSKAGPAVPIWVNTDTSAATGSDSFVIQSNASTYTTDAGTKNKHIIFEVDPSYLDGANGFKDVTISTGASNAANITECTAYLIQRVDGTAAPTALVD